MVRAPTTPEEAPLVKGTASAVPSRTGSQTRTALPKAGVKRKARNDRSAFLRAAYPTQAPPRQLKLVILRAAQNLRRCRCRCSCRRPYPTLVLSTGALHPHPPSFRPKPPPAPTLVISTEAAHPAPPPSSRPKRFSAEWRDPRIGFCFCSCSCSCPCLCSCSCSCSCSCPCLCSCSCSCPCPCPVHRATNVTYTVTNNPPTRISQTRDDLPEPFLDPQISSRRHVPQLNYRRN